MQKEDNYFIMDYSAISSQVSDYGIALPLFSSLEKKDLSHDSYHFTVPSTTSTTKKSSYVEGPTFTSPEVNAPIDFYFPGHSYYKYSSRPTVEGEVVFVFKTASQTYYTCFQDLPFLRSSFPEAIYVPASSPHNLPSSWSFMNTGDLLATFTFPASESVTIQEYCVTHKVSDPSEYEFVSLFSYSLPSWFESEVHVEDSVWITEPSQYLYNPHLNLGYYENAAIVPGSTVLERSIRSGSIVPVDSYFKKCISPSSLLSSICNTFGYHISYNSYDSSIKIIPDFTASLTTPVSSPFNSIQIESISPQYYTENEIKFKYSACDDWFSSQYNELFPENPLGSGSFLCDYTSEVPNIDSKSHVESTFSYSPFSNTNASIATGSNLSQYLSQILYDADGNLVDISGALLFANYENASVGFNVTYDDTDEPGVIVGLSGTHRYSIPVSGYIYNYESCYKAGSTIRADAVAFGVQKYYPTGILFNPLYSTSPSKALISFESLVSNQSTVANKAYAAKKINFTAIVTNLVEPLQVYSLPNVGLCIPTTIKHTIKEDYIKVTVEGFLYTQDPVYDATVISVEVQAADPTQGSASISPYPVHKNDTVTITATPNEGYVFSSWNAGPRHIAENPYTFIAGVSETWPKYVAVFVPE